MIGLQYKNGCSIIKQNICSWHEKIQRRTIAVKKNNNIRKKFSIYNFYNEKGLRFFCIVYVIIAIFVLHGLLRGFEPDFENILEVITQMAYLLFCPMIYVILSYQKKVFSQKERCYAHYYNMQFQGEDRLKYAKSTTISDVRRTVKILFGVIALISLVYVIDELIEIYVPIREEIIEEGPVGIIIGMYGLIIALFQWSKMEVDKKCMFFSVDNLPVFKRCNRKITLSVVILIAHITTFFVVKNSVEILCFMELLWFILFGSILFDFIYMFYEQIDIERNVIKKIDRYYHTEKILVLPQRIWYKGAAISKFTDLLNNYYRMSSKISLEDIEKIEFSSIFDEGNNNKKRAVIKYYIYSVSAFIILVAAICFLTRELNESLRIVYGSVTLIGFLPVMLLWLSPKYIERNFRFVNWMTYISWWGYYIKVKDKKVEKFVSSYGIKYSVYQKLVLQLKRVICFYNLSIKMKYHDEDDFGMCGIDNICAYISDKEHKGENVEFMLIPLLICVCIYDQGHKNNNSSVKKIIENVGISRETKIKITYLCILVLRELHGDDRSFEEEKYKNCIENYLGGK